MFSFIQETRTDKSNFHYLCIQVCLKLSIVCYLYLFFFVSETRLQIFIFNFLGEPQKWIVNIASHFMKMLNTLERWFALYVLHILLHWNNNRWICHSFWKTNKASHSISMCGKNFHAKIYVGNFKMLNLSNIAHAPCFNFTKKTLLTRCRVEVWDRFDKLICTLCLYFETSAELVHHQKLLKSWV